MVKISERPEASDAPLGPRRKPVQARSLERLARIIDAAHRVLKVGGATALTTNAVAAEAGMSIGSLYEYFPNKESIIMQLYEGKLALLRERTPPIGVYGPGEDDWRVFISNYIRVLKAAEHDLDLDASIYHSLRNLPRLYEVERLHAEWIADEVAEHLKHFGSRWSDAALFDLGMYLYSLDSATWNYWIGVGAKTQLALDRVISATIAVVSPAMDGSPEPSDTLMQRQGDAGTEEPSGRTRLSAPRPKSRPRPVSPRPKAKNGLAS